jgi:polyphenol oxidase
MNHFIDANWPAPNTIRAGTTTILHGHSQGTYAANNLALHVEDIAEHVHCNREQLQRTLNLPGEPAWLNQTHSTKVVVVENETQRNADASITRSKTIPLVILTADCLPIVLCDRAGTEIAAIHAGWRGLYDGIIQETVHKMQTSAEHLIAWIGPAICQRCYETSVEVKDKFLEKYPFLEHCFSNRHANLPAMAEKILKQHGVSGVYHSNHCTFEEKNLYYSYRRVQQTGRMGTFIWFRDGL